MSRTVTRCLAMLGVLAISSDHACGQETPPGPVRVFLLVGQSNMEGKGSVQQFEQVAKAKPERYGQWRKGSQWAKRDDVWCIFNDKAGPLSLGFGSPHDRCMGPEVGFGEVLGNTFDEPVVLLKACWGGQSLGNDFRPPSSGGHAQPFVLDDGIQWKAGSTGWAYKEIFNLVHQRLGDLGATIPQLKGRRCEIVGLVWFQGWNDLIDADFRAQYQANLANFIRDIRRDLKMPALPVIIGESGQDGDKPTGDVQAIRDAQRAAAGMPEFKGTVSFVKTASFWRDTEPNHDGGYHFNGNAETFYDMGEAFGKGMVALLKSQPTPPAKKKKKKKE